MRSDGAPSLTKSSDGPVSVLINRRISLMISGPMAAAGMSPNWATMISLAIGAGSAAAYVLEIWWLAGLLIQFASIFGGVDGEIARRTGKTSRYGDFLDTVVDRFVEYGAILAIGLGLQGAYGKWAWLAALLALGGTFVLTSASEKYRSVMQRNYPKRQFEPIFAALVSGRDVRIFYLAVASIAATAHVGVLLWTLVAIGALMHLNFAYRVVLLRQKMDAG